MADWSMAPVIFSPGAVIEIVARSTNYTKPIGGVIESRDPAIIELLTNAITMISVNDQRDRTIEDLLSIVPLHCLFRVPRP